MQNEQGHRESWQIVVFSDAEAQEVLIREWSLDSGSQVVPRLWARLRQEGGAFVGKPSSPLQVKLAALGLTWIVADISDVFHARDELALGELLELLNIADSQLRVLHTRTSEAARDEAEDSWSAQSKLGFLKARRQLVLESLERSYGSLATIVHEVLLPSILRVQYGTEECYATAEKLLARYREFDDRFGVLRVDERVEFMRSEMYESIFNAMVNPFSSRERLALLLEHDVGVEFVELSNWIACLMPPRISAWLS